MNYELLVRQINSGVNLAENYVFPRIFMQNSLDELSKNISNPYFYRFNKTEKLNNFAATKAYPKLLLLSEPGYGKSEFLKQYANHLINLSDQDNILPLYIELKGYKPSRHSLDKYIEEQLKLKYEFDMKLSAPRQNHKPTFILDGFDEVEKNDFGRIIEEIKLFLLSYKNDQIIISSRLHFYLRYPLLENQNLSIAHIDSFDNEEIKQYLNAKGIEENEADRIIDIFQEPDFSSILTIPRYLEKYFELYRTENTGRLSKADIYNHFINSRLEIEDKKYPGRSLKSYYRIFLEKLALIMEIFQQNSITVSEFASVIDQCESGAIKAITAKENLEYLTERNILVEYGDQISFEDRSLQEYLAASEMAKWRDQKKVYDLTVIEEFGEINPSWINTLAYYLDLDKSFFEYAINYNPDLVLKSNIETLSPVQRTKIFKRILANYQEKKIWIDYNIAKRIARLYSDSLKQEIGQYMTSSAHFVQRGNIATILGFIPLPEYKQWLIDCANDDNQNGVLQRRAIYSLKEFGDVDVIEKTKKAFSHQDAHVRDAFLNMCGQVNPSAGTAYFLDAINRSIEEGSTALVWLAEIKEREPLIKVLERISSDKNLLVKFCKDSRDRYVENIFKHIEDIYDEGIKDLLIKLVFSLLKAYEHDSSMIHYIAVLLRNKVPDVWEIILRRISTTDNVKEYLFRLPSFFSYFITENNIHEYIEITKHVVGHEWLSYRLVLYISKNKENPSHSIIEQRARKLFPENYQKVDEHQRQQAIKLSHEERRFLRWKNVFDITPLQYNKAKFGLFYQCIDEFNEAFKLDENADRKIKIIVKSVLSKIDPEKFHITIVEWGKDGGVSQFRPTWEQDLYEKAIKLNFTLSIGFTERKKLIYLLRVLHSSEYELIKDILKTLGHLQSDEIEIIKGFLEDRVYTAISTYIQIVKEKKLIGCVDLLKKFINDNKIEHYYKIECIETIEELTHDKNYIENIFLDDTLDERIKKKIAQLLITKHNDEKALRWQAELLKHGYPPDDWRWGGTTSWLGKVKTANAIAVYIGLLETSYSFSSDREEYAEWLRHIALEGLKFQNSEEAVKALRKFIDENIEKIEGVNFLEYIYEQIQKEWLIIKGKPTSMIDAIVRYSEISRKAGGKIPDEYSLSRAIIEVFEKNIRHSIEEEGGYKNFYRDAKYEEPKSEPEVQHLFRTWRQHFKDLGIYMTQEAETGRGPVDYAFNYGFIPKIQNCHLEIKLTTHPSIPRSFEPQLQTYIVADDAVAAIFLVIRVAKSSGPFPEDMKWLEWQGKITTKCEVLAKQKGIMIKAIFIDAIKKPSASRVKKTSDN